MDRQAKPWGVYGSRCLLCDLKVVTVCEVLRVKRGEVDPFRVLCEDCEEKAQSWPGSHVPVLTGVTRERVKGDAT